MVDVELIAPEITRRPRPEDLLEALRQRREGQGYEDVPVELMAEPGGEAEQGEVTETKEQWDKLLKKIRVKRAPRER